MNLGYSANIRHIYNPCFAPNGKWIIATAHGGMGVDHGRVAIAANGATVVNLHMPGCRAGLSPDGQWIAWGASDFEIAVAPIDLEAEHPQVGPRRLRILDPQNRLIHVDWSPDGHFLCFSRGPAGRGEPLRPGTFSGPDGLMGALCGRLEPLRRLRRPAGSPQPGPSDRGRLLHANDRWLQQQGTGLVPGRIEVPERRSAPTIDRTRGALSAGAIRFH